MSGFVQKALPEENYAPWVDEAFLLPQKERVDKIERTLESLSRISKKGENLARSMADGSEFEKASFLGYIHYVPMRGVKPGFVRHAKFKVPVVAMKHKKLPIIMAVGATPYGKDVEIDRVKDSLGVKQILSYGQTLSKMSEIKKFDLAELAIDGIKTYRQEESKDPGKEWLSEYLEKQDENGEFELVGFALNLPYINVDPKFGNTKSFWVHAWGTPQLFYSHRDMPGMMIVGPSVRLDKNVLGEVDMTGYTG